LRHAQNARARRRGCALPTFLNFAAMEQPKNDFPDPIVNPDAPRNNNMNRYILAAIVILFFIPVFYLFFNSKNKDVTPPAAQPEASQTQDPVVSFEQAVNANPNFQNLINLGIAYQNNGRVEESIKVFKRALQLQPNNQIALNNIGVSYIMSSHFMEADTALNKALQMDSTFQLAKNNKAWLELEKKNFIEQIAKMEAVPADQRKPQDFIDLGLKYYALHEYQKSIDLFDQCIQKDPENSLAYNNRGTSLMFLNKFEEAKASFQKAVDLDGSVQLFRNNVRWAEDELAKQQK
jgi:Flp pilus assembly protein TadD